MKRDREPLEIARTSRGTGAPSIVRAEFAGRARWSRSLPYALLALVAFAVYANTLWNGLVYDDKVILQSPLLHDPWNVARVFDNKFYGAVADRLALYRPLSNWSYLVNHRINEILTGSGASFAGFHLVNILLHAAVGCLLFAWLALLSIDRRVALSTAVLFAVLPIHTETVANITGRSDAQAAMFGLAFLIFHRRGAWFLAAPAYLLALWSKESAIAFLPLAVAVDLCLRAGPRRPALARYAPYAAVALVWFFLRADAMRNVGKDPPPLIENPLIYTSVALRLLTAVRVQLDYLRLQLFPRELSSDYSFNQLPVVTSALDPGFLAFLAVCVAAIALAWIVRKREPAVLLAVAGYAILFSTTSNVLVPIGTIMAERLAYMPSIFFCCLLAIGVWSLETWIGARAVTAAIFLVAGAYAVRTFAQNRVWHDELSLFEEQVRTAPNSAKSHLNYGATLAAAGRDRDALIQYERSLAIYDKFGLTYYLIGNALRRLKEDPEKIIAAYRAAIANAPGHLDARVNLALTLIEQRRFDEARVLAQEIAARDPHHPSLPSLALQLARPVGAQDKK